MWTQHVGPGRYRQLMPVVRTYRPDQRPDVEILVDGRWCKGELRQWSVDSQQQWSAQVSWRRRAGQTRIDTFPAEVVRLDETSRTPHGPEPVGGPFTSPKIGKSGPAPSR